MDEDELVIVVFGNSGEWSGLFARYESKHKDIEYVMAINLLGCLRRSKVPQGDECFIVKSQS